MEKISLLDTIFPAPGRRKSHRMLKAAIWLLVSGMLVVIAYLTVTRTWA